MMLWFYIKHLLNLKLQAVQFLFYTSEEKNRLAQFLMGDFLKALIKQNFQKLECKIDGPDCFFWGDVL